MLSLLLQKSQNMERVGNNSSKMYNFSFIYMWILKKICIKHEIFDMQEMKCHRNCIDMYDTISIILFIQINEQYISRKTNKSYYV